MANFLYFLEEFWRVAIYCGKSPFILHMQSSHVAHRYSGSDIFSTLFFTLMIYWSTIYVHTMYMLVLIKQQIYMFFF